MLSLLQNIIEIVGFLPEYILDGIEQVINLFFAGVQALWEAAVSLIPLPEIPAVPEYISAINWFFPVGAVISIMVPVMIGYIAFLAIRWIYKWAGAL
jgi:hypothetical protein